MKVLETIGYTPVQHEQAAETPAESAELSFAAIPCPRENRTDNL